MRDRTESGGVIPMLAVMMTVLITFAAFAVDLGMQRVARRDMQALADVVALDMARHLDGKTQAVIKARDSWRSGVGASVERNLDLSPTERVDVVQQQEQAIATVPGQDLKVTVVMGTVDPLTGSFAHPIPYPDVPNAVRVTAESSVEFHFAQVVGADKGGVSRSAVGSARTNACFRIGSFAVGLNRDPATLIGMLNPILGDTDLTAVSYAGLADAQVSLADLIRAPQINAGSVDALLQATDISVADLMLATASVLRDDQRNLVEAALLERLAGISLVRGINVALGRVLSLTAGGDAAALDVDVNVLDLIAGAASVANGTNFVGVPALKLDVPNLLSTTQSVKITEAPRLACGTEGVQAKTAQVQINASGTVGTTLPMPLGGQLTIGGPLVLNATLGQATATLGKVTCGPDVIPISTSTALTTLSQSLELAIAGNDIGLGSNIEGVPGLLTVDISLKKTVGSSLSKASPSGTLLTWKIPSEDTYSTVKRVSSEQAVLPHASTSAALELDVSDVRIAGVKLAHIPLLGFLVEGLILDTVTMLVNGILGAGGALTNAVSQLVSSTVNPVIDQLNSVVGRLTGALGLRLAGADVSVVPTARCNAPLLRG